MAENRLLDDLAKFGNSTLTAMTGFQQQVRKWAAEKVDSLVDSMELVSRQELDVYKEVAQKALAKSEELEQRLAALEAGLAAKNKTSDENRAPLENKAPAESKAKTKTAQKPKAV